MGQGAGRGFFKSGGIDQAKGEAIEIDLDGLPVAGDARRVMHDGGVTASQPVDQPGLSDIGPSNDGESEHRYLSATISASLV